MVSIDFGIKKEPHYEKKLELPKQEALPAQNIQEK
jgi:hypothetical protein